MKQTSIRTAQLKLQKEEEHGKEVLPEVLVKIVDVPTASHPHPVPVPSRPLFLLSFGTGFGDNSP